MFIAMNRFKVMYAFNSVNSIRSCCARLPPMRSLSFAIGSRCVQRPDRAHLRYA